MNSAMAGTAAAAYQQVARRSEIQGASPHRLIALLYEAAINNIKKAEIALEIADANTKGQAINKTIDIITELRSSLDKESGGDIAENLELLYLHMQSSLMQANSNSDVFELGRVKSLITDLSDTWNTISSNGSNSEKPTF